ncbi:uncharacterized protein LOC143301526 [Babylonia areolata]|uniref:uncharacterized protein LOC143301480 n=1 Tax=Babylonia areolata TaxID=304850 RepID=UPI003FD328F8
MAGRTPTRTTSWQDKLPPSPLGATPRPHLRQVYPKPPEGTYLSEFELNRSTQSGTSSTTTKTSYTLLRSQHNSLDKVDSVDYTPLPPVDYPPSPAEEAGGSCTKSVVVLALVFFLSLVALGVVFIRLGPTTQK